MEEDAENEAIVAIIGVVSPTESLLRTDRHSLKSETVWGTLK